MNYYTDTNGDKYYCLNPINLNTNYYWTTSYNNLEIIYNAQIENIIHRDNGPAIEGIRGGKHWIFMGKYHREDGPAVEYPDGDKYWYYHGELIYCKSQDEFEKIMKMKAFL